MSWTVMPSVGQLVGIWDGTHLTRMKVVKHNKTTFDCVEEEKSHSPGKEWRIHHKNQYCTWGELPDGTRRSEEWHNRPVDDN